MNYFIEVELWFSELGPPGLGGWLDFLPIYFMECPLNSLPFFLHISAHSILWMCEKIPINSLAAGLCGNNFEGVIFYFMLRIEFLSTFNEIILRWMSQNLINDNLSLVQDFR